jgi:hypothetical protein
MTTFSISLLAVLTIATVWGLLVHKDDGYIIFGSPRDWWWLNDLKRFWAWLRRHRVSEDATDEALRGIAEDPMAIAKVLEPLQKPWTPFQCDCTDGFIGVQPKFIGVQPRMPTDKVVTEHCLIIGREYGAPVQCRFDTLYPEYQKELLGQRVGYFTKLSPYGGFVIDDILTDFSPEASVAKPVDHREDSLIEAVRRNMTARSELRILSDRYANLVETHNRLQDAVRDLYRTFGCEGVEELEDRKDAESWRQFNGRPS